MLELVILSFGYIEEERGIYCLVVFALCVWPIADSHCTMCHDHNVITTGSLGPGNLSLPRI